MSYILFSKNQERVKFKIANLATKYRSNHMLSKNKIKFIKSLQQKKFRNETSTFVVEGRKGIAEVLKAKWEVKELYLSESIATRLGSFLDGVDFVVESEANIERASGLKNNKEGIAVVQYAESQKINWEKGFVLYLDGVSDPGNLGTILRTADWFGIEHVICSSNTVDFYNPKVIQSTMGAFTRVIPTYFSFEELKAQMPVGYPVYTTFLDGDSPKRLQETKSGLLVMGSESHGVSKEFLDLNPVKITIPSQATSGSESLNVAIATSVLCYELNRGE